MKRIGEYGRVWRFAALALLLVAFLGPWAMERINVPAEYPCSVPFVRLRGDYCGLPFTGAAMISAIVEELGSRAGALAAGDATRVALRDTLPMILFAIPAVLPFVIAALSVPRGESRRRHLFRLVVWGLAVAWSLWWLAVSASVSPPFRVWGISLYAGLACVALTLEGMALVNRRKSAEAM
jgi:hypothetical protein